MQSLTLVIWGACRTLDGPGFEPLISKASECDSFEDKKPRGEYSVTIRERRGVAGHASGFFAGRGRRGPVRAVRCGCAFSGVYLGQAKWRGRRLTDGIVNSRAVPAGYRATVLLRARVGDSTVMGPSRQ